MPMQQQGLAGLLSSPLAQGLLTAGLGAMASRGSTMQALGRGGLLGLSTFGQAEGAKQSRLMEMAQEQMRNDALAKADGGQGLSRQELMMLSDDPAKWAAIMQGGRPKLEMQDFGGYIGGVDPYTNELRGRIDKTPTIGERMTDANNAISIAGGQPRLNTQLWNAQQMSANADLNRDIQRAAGTEAIAARGDLVAVPDEQGATVMMPREQALAYLGGGQPQPQQPSQQAGAQGDGFGRTLPDSVVKARESLDSAVANVDAMESTINGILNHPGLDKYIGTVTGAGWAKYPGTDEANFKVRLDQLQGQAFLQARDQLKGQGAISDSESDQASAAFLRANRAQSPEEFRESMQEALGILQRAKERAYRAAQVDMPEGRQGGTSANQQRPGLNQIFGF